MSNYIKWTGKQKINSIPVNKFNLLQKVYFLNKNGIKAGKIIQISAIGKEKIEGWLYTIALLDIIVNVDTDSIFLSDLEYRVESEIWKDIDSIVESYKGKEQSNEKR